MKRFIAGILAILAFVSTSPVHADFFLDRIVRNSPEKARMEDLSIKKYSFKNAANAASYRDSLYFVSKVKNETIRRYEDGRISSYRFSDTTNELENLTYSLNQYFANLSDFERTGNHFYRELAMRNLSNAQTTYVRLKAITIKR